MNQHDGNREPNGTEKQHGGNKSGLWVDHQANRQSPELLIEINDFVRRQLDKDIIHKIKTLFIRLRGWLVGAVDNLDSQNLVYSYICQPIELCFP